METLFLLFFQMLGMKAFVVPTGSMNPTVLGFHKEVICPRCFTRLTVNASMEADKHPQLPPSLVTGCTCFNCRHELDFTKEKRLPALRGGDRLFCTAFQPEPIREEQRFRLTVYTHPSFLRDHQQRRFYLGRCVAFPGETLAIHQGQLFRSSELKYPKEKIPSEQVWSRQHMRRNDPQAVKLFEQGRFQILRKSPAMMLAFRRLVHDNNFAPPGEGQVSPNRWLASKDGGWTTISERGFRHDGKAATTDWLRYRHAFRTHQGQAKPELITDFQTFNSGLVNENRFVEENWVGDLMLECQVTVEKAKGEMWLELVKGVDRFQARWQLTNGMCKLVRIDRKGNVQQLGEKKTTLHQPGRFRLRFANFDQRLTLWIDDDLPFGEGINYQGPAIKGPTNNDLEPVSIAGKETAIQVRHLQIWRNNYYTVEPSQPDVDLDRDDRSNPDKWGPLRDPPLATFFVQPGHFLFLGDNSPRSSDSRDWGVVPQNLIHWQIVLRYYPFDRVGGLR